METDTEITYNSNIISNYNLTPRTKKKYKESEVIKYIVKVLKLILFYIAIIILIIFIIKKNSLSKIKQRKELTNIILNLEAIINNQQK